MRVSSKVKESLIFFVPRVRRFALDLRIKKGIINSGFQLLQTLESFVAFLHAHQSVLTLISSTVLTTHENGRETVMSPGDMRNSLICIRIHLRKTAEIP